MGKRLVYWHKEEKIAVVWIDHPLVNVLSHEVLNQLEEAKQIRLVNRVVPQGMALMAARVRAAKIAGHSAPALLRELKRVWTKDWSCRFKKRSYWRLAIWVSYFKRSKQKKASRHLSKKERYVCDSLRRH
ncbi:hypothetical protein [Brevibacillus choshinensis]|uniref:hypothetical protein n=1 Tax=Brevibacillus choshinensis TaxID=54911 RepID=UPI002E1B9D97|nr:hypothetical protein [Brevibacillus choshinensis]